MHGDHPRLPEWIGALVSELNLNEWVRMHCEGIKGPLLRDEETQNSHNHRKL